jgi:hypothetical protein
MNLRRIALLSLIAIGCCACRKQQGPTLSETLAWMDQTYNPHESFGDGHGKERIYHSRTSELWWGSNETFTYNGCQMVLHREDLPSSKPYIFRYPESFNLRDIDPQTVKVRSFDPNDGTESCDDPEHVSAYKLNCTAAYVQFSTHNDLPTIDDLPDHEHRKTTTNKAEFVVDDAAYAQRFAKAFQHAVELCGGKPSAF